MRRAFLWVGVGTVVSALVSACMTRPLTSTRPHTSNLYVEPVHNEVIDKLDLLFMIDNSASMGDKQKLLSRAVPQLVNRLVVPRCVNKAGAIQLRSNLTDTCPAGMAPEFRAVQDIHVAVITSSLGRHGAAGTGCPASPPNDDRALLLPRVRDGLASYNNSGFLAWDPKQALTPPGEADPARLGEQFSQMVQKTGEDGCGYESSLESWYRFLIDPEPPKEVVPERPNGVPETSFPVSVVHGVDEDVLAQRAAFLRPDSLVAIVMLTDENDCSIRDEGYGYMLANTDPKSTPMLRGNSACDRDPNDPCCAPCLAGTQSGCPSIADDPACKLGNNLDPKSDSTNLRCWDDKRRFGYDFLYPTSRYVDALTQPLVPQRSTGKMVENPLFKPAPGQPPRSQGLVYLAGIVGVPWQDIADDASQKGAGLRYLTAEELSAQKRWDVLIGDRAENAAPSDPFMRESVMPRSGTNPITGDAIVAETSLNPTANAINGHEQGASGDDLQYACTFKLAEPAPCEGDSCDCDPAGAAGGELGRNRPLCQPPSGGPAGGTQYFGKAYPGLRPLEVLKGIGDSAIVASICPKVLTEGQAGYGYEPAVDAIVGRLKAVLTGRCLPRPLAVEADGGGKLPCVVVEATAAATTGTGSCACNSARRSPASPEAQTLVRAQLAGRKQCDTATTPACSSFCMCELAQSEGPALDQCLNNEAGSETPGYCYVDPFGAVPHGNPALVADCDSSERQLLRFVGPDTPTPGATAFIACLGATLN